MSNENFNKFKDNKVNEALNKYDNLGHITGKGSEVNQQIMQLKDKAVDLVSDFTAQGKRMFNKINSIVNGEIDAKGSAKAVVVNKNKAVAKDWRVSLSVPESIKKLVSPSRSLLDPLGRTDWKMVFPYTPTIYVSHQASYNPLQPVHTNYPYYAYENSRVGQMTITGEFFVQNSLEAKYWVAAVHFLRSVTKMSYGEKSPNRGQPPPVLFLNGYGDYTFNQVPVIITNFQFDLKREVDYISTGLGKTEQAYEDGYIQSSLEKYAWAPSESMITVEVVPQYSRNQISKFNLRDFVNGDDVLDGKGFI
tara:strand:+ start:993 stop:1910 length:918 start_codon:yes stop_codon:yes gene_type:complete